MSRATLALLQLCDSLFPVGAFAHSDGLEAAVAGHGVSSTGDLRVWMQTLLVDTLVACEGPALRDAFAAYLSGDYASIAVLDDEQHAMRPSASGREASRTMGTRLLSTWQHIRPTSALGDLRAARDRTCLPVAFGIVCADSGASRVEALESFMYTRLASSVSAAMRLIALGQHDAHALLAELLEEVPARALRVDASSVPPRSFTPLLDITTMSHQYVFSRLFRS